MRPAAGVGGLKMRQAMNIEEIQERFKLLGLRKAFRPRLEPESGAVLIEVRRPVQIVGGRLQGSEISLYDAETFRVWTSRKKKVRALAVKHGLRARLMSGEAELFVLAALADMILPVFGAITRRAPSPRQLAALKVGWDQARNRLNLRKRPRQNEVPAIGAPGVAPQPPADARTPVSPDVQVVPRPGSESK